jgi:hypothetical protein
MTKKLQGSLRYSTQSKTLQAEDLRPWLEQIYPPAIMDGKGGVEQITGNLVLKPAGQNATNRWMVLEGTVQFRLDNATRITYSGELAMVLEYGLESGQMERIRGVCECVFPKHNPQGQVVERIAMTAAIESRPR